MPTEIERKFLINPDHRLWPQELWMARGKELTQGYLCVSPCVRVRIANQRYWDAQAWITVKGKGLISRPEFEYQVPPEQAEEMLKLCGDLVIQKIRYKVQVRDRTWEVDKFLNRYQVDWLAEVELRDEEEELVIPEWVGKEVTQDPRYQNLHIAQFGFPKGT